MTTLTQNQMAVVENEFKKIEEKLDNHKPLISFNSYPREEKKWPNDLAQEAFHGLAGEVVNTILPQTEADPAALLLNFIVAFSSSVGRSPYFKISGTKNHLNVFGVVVGKTASARKGTAWGSVKEIFKAQSPEWQINNLVSGLSSGEGLIWRVRDPIFKREPVKNAGRVVDYQEIEADSGILDKRLLVVEPEFCRVLKSIAREGNILSIVIRESFDSGDLSTLTRTSPAKSTGASIAIIGQITMSELLRNLCETELANGFANRFIWMVVKQSKSLPEGGNLTNGEIQNLAEKVNEVISFAHTVEQMRRDSEAKEIWKRVYEELGKEKPGMYGAIVARAQAIVARLSCIYALLDKSPTVQPVHLKAALAVWDRAEASVKYIFGTKIGDPVGDSILSALESQGVLDQTQINELFKGNVKSDRIRLALADLKEYGLINHHVVETGGRPKAVWSLIHHPKE